jgi:hypothetical protein
MTTTMTTTTMRADVKIARPASFLVAAACLLLLSACGLTAPRSSEGFADLESLGMFDTNRVMSLSIGPTLLRFAAKYIDDDPEVRDLLRSLDGVRVRIYEIDGDPRRVAGRIGAMSEHLQAEGWEPVVLVREKNEETHMLLRMSGGQIQGMTVLTSDGDSEAVVVNLMGDIQPEQFGDVMVALDVNAPGIEDVKVAGTPNG